jgi:hypothetical protein
VLAESTATLRQEVAGAAPVLWFPAADVVDAVGATTGAGRFAGHVAFDPDEVQVELLDVLPGDDPGAASTKRFPTWGDAADLIDVLDGQPTGDGRFTTVARADWRRPVVEGSQMLGQAIVAAGRLAQFTGHLSIAAALRPHAGIGQDQAHRTLSTAINAIGIAVHREVRADRWMLYHHESTNASDGMTHAECRVFDEGGDLLASFTVDAMVRGFADPTAPVDDRTAM